MIYLSSLLIMSYLLVKKKKKVKLCVNFKINSQSTSRLKDKFSVTTLRIDFSSLQIFENASKMVN